MHVRMWDAGYLTHLHLLLHLKLMVGNMRGTARCRELVWEPGRRCKSLHELVLDGWPEATWPIHDRHSHGVWIHSVGDAAQDSIHQAWHAAVRVVAYWDMPVGMKEIEVVHDLASR